MSEIQPVSDPRPISPSPLNADFFQRDALEVAGALVGCGLYVAGCGGEIVETEAYRAEGDPACHTFFRTKARTFVRDHAAGALYVYLNYGVHWLLNFLTRDLAGREGFVLIRALRPTAGLEKMAIRRGVKPGNVEALCSGPGKLTRALDLDLRWHGVPATHLELHPARPNIRIGRDFRIGISRARDFPWRFLDLEQQKWVSRPVSKLGSYA